MNFQNQIDWLHYHRNEDMFSGVVVPKELDPETLKSQIVFRCGLLWPAYSEPEIQKAAITQFFRREQWNIKHLVNIILAEYSPIENTDRYSEHTTEEEGGGSSTHSGTDQRNVTTSGTDQRDIQESGTDQRDVSSSGSDQREIQESGTTTVTREVSAYNSSGYQADNKETTAHGKKTDDDVTYGKKTDDDVTYGKKTDDDVTYGKVTNDNVTYGHKITDEKTGKSSYTEHTHGNIGVTTNQEMIRQELELLEAFDIYDWIAAKMEKELFLQVY